MPETASMYAVFSFQHPYRKEECFKKVAKYPYYQSFRSEVLEIEKVAFTKKAGI